MVGYDHSQNLQELPSLTTFFQYLHSKPDFSDQLPPAVLPTLRFVAVSACCFAADQGTVMQRQRCCPAHHELEGVKCRSTIIIIIIVIIIVITIMIILIVNIIIIIITIIIVIGVLKFPSSS